MLGSLSSAVSGLDVFQEDMDVIGNNIANSNTNAFKASTVDIGNSFSNTLLTATSGSGSDSGGLTMQVGTGATIDAVTTNWQNGTLSNTNNFNDVAISGNGFFLVADPTTKTTYATQDGQFNVDPSGYLVDANGYRVQGFAVTSAAGVTPVTYATTPSDIQVGSGVNGQFSVSSTGVVSYYDATTASQTIVGQLALQTFNDPSALVSVGGNLYTNMTAAEGPTAIAPAAAGSSGSLALTTVQQGYAELSNVNLSSEMANMITAERGFEANSKIVTASDELLQTVVNMVR